MSGAGLIIAVCAGAVAGTLVWIGVPVWVVFPVGLAIGVVLGKWLR